MDTSSPGRVARVLAVLGIIMGVLAMHGLVGGHHGSVPVVGDSAASASTGHSAIHSPAAAADDVVPLGFAHESVASAAAFAMTPLHEAVGGCDGECSETASGLLLLCVAVLLAAGMAVLRALGTASWRVRQEAGPPGRRQLTAALPRRLDPVADLCVSRT